MDELTPGSRFAAATAAVTLCVGLSYAADTSAGGATGTWASLYLAVALAALIGGESPGLFATAVGSAAAIAFTVTAYPPAGLPRHAVEIGVFLITGILISIAGGTLREARRRALQMETRLHLMADNAPVLMWLGRADGARTWVNRSWLSFTGRTPEEEEGIGWQEGLHPDDRQGTLARCDAALARGEAFELEYRLRHRDGGYRWVVDRAVPVRDSAGALTGFVGSCTDIHDRREAEREREELLVNERLAREEAERANQAKEEFLGVVSHELRAPLNAIVGWTYLLREQIDDPAETRRALAVIERNARAQVQIVDNLLDMSRLLSGTLSFASSRVDLRTSLEHAVDAVESLLVDRHLTLERRLPDDPVTVAGDGARLEQVINHLLSNAIKFTPQGGHIAVALEEHGGLATLTVRDSGRGIPPDFLPHAFDRFRQADASRTRRHGGLGIGLALVKGIVTQHGGLVAVESQGIDSGATFTVTLPLASDGPAADFHALAQPNARPLEHVRILVVDDDADTCELLRLLLEDVGAVVRTSTSVRDALGRWALERPDVLVSDIGMPDQDGYALVREIRRMEPDRGGTVPALALTAFGRPEDQQAALQAGFQMHLRKPVEPGDLVSVIAGLARH